MDQVVKYFTAEKGESLVFIAIGILALALSVYLLCKIKTPFTRGMSYALIGVALIQLTVGLSVYFRSNKDLARVDRYIAETPEKVASEEIPRMETVMKNFLIYRWIEIGLIALGLILYIVCPDTSLCKGLGLGLMIQAVLMLALDYFAEARGTEYLDFLKEISS